MVRLRKQRQIFALISILLIFLLGFYSISEVTAEAGDCIWWEHIKSPNTFSWKILAYNTENGSLSGFVDIGNLNPEVDDVLKLQINGTLPENYHFHTEAPDYRHDPWFKLIIGEKFHENKTSDPFPFILPQRIYDNEIEKYGVGYISEAYYSLLLYLGDPNHAWLNGLDNNTYLPLPPPPPEPSFQVNLTFIHTDRNMNGTIIWNVQTGLLRYAKITGTENSIVEIDLVIDSWLSEIWPPFSGISSTNNSDSSSKRNLIIGFEWFTPIILFPIISLKIKNSRGKK